MHANKAVPDVHETQAKGLLRRGPKPAFNKSVPLLVHALGISMLLSFVVHSSAKSFVSKNKEND